MDVIVTILIGLSVGVMVELLLPGHTASELALAILLGVAGSLVARFLGFWLGWYESNEALGFTASVLGAAIVLLLYGAFFRRKRKG